MQCVFQSNVVYIHSCMGIHVTDFSIRMFYQVNVVLEYINLFNDRQNLNGRHFLPALCF